MAGQLGEDGGAGDEGGGDSPSGPADLLLGRVLARRSCVWGCVGTERAGRAGPTWCRRRGALGIDSEKNDDEKCDNYGRIQ